MGLYFNKNRKKGIKLIALVPKNEVEYWDNHTLIHRIKYGWKIYLCNKNMEFEINFN